MYTQKLLDLKDDYIKERKIEMTEDQFCALLYAFPSILVANADGKIDRKERSFMRELPEVLTEGHMHDGVGMVTDVTMTKDFFLEMDYIIQNLGAWEKRFLEVLKEQLAHSKNERNAIFEMMWRTADSSEDISEEERHKINEVSTTLGLNHN